MQHVFLERELSYDWRHDRRLAACAIAAALLAAAASDARTGNGFQTFLRIYVCGLGTALALSEWRRGRLWLPLSAILIAIFFNPIRPIEIERSAWQLYCWGAAAWFVAVGAFRLVHHLPRAVFSWLVAAALVAAVTIPAVMTLQAAQRDQRRSRTVDATASLADTIARGAPEEVTAAADPDPLTPHAGRRLGHSPPRSLSAAAEHALALDAQELSDESNLAMFDEQLNSVGPDAVGGVTSFPATGDIED
ncbi:MAG: DUF6804 family protein [Bacillota bacterium]